MDTYFEAVVTYIDDNGGECECGLEHEASLGFVPKAGMPVELTYLHYPCVVKEVALVFAGQGPRLEVHLSQIKAETRQRAATIVNDLKEEGWLVSWAHVPATAATNN